MCGLREEILELLEHRCGELEPTPTSDLGLLRRAANKIEELQFVQDHWEAAVDAQMEGYDDHDCDYKHCHCVVILRESVKRLRLLLDEIHTLLMAAPELNMGNYSDDDVCALNNATIGACTLLSTWKGEAAETNEGTG